MRIFVAGHNGMVGSSIVRKLKLNHDNIIIVRSKSELDLTNQQQVNQFFSEQHIDQVYLCAAKVGGILANNTNRADFIYENLMIESNVIHASYVYKVKKLCFLGSSCIYPKLCPQPIKESYLLTGELEETNQPYAIAKIAGIELCKSYRKQYGCNFISVMPTNLYGPNDNYHLDNSHVLPALLRKFITAKQTNQEEVTIWGTGTPRREFLHVDDLADACIHLMNVYNEEEPVNIGCGEDISILELALLIKDIVQYSGQIIYDLSKPDGTPRKLLNISKLQTLGWYPKINIRQGIQQVYQELKDINFL